MNLEEFIEKHPGLAKEVYTLSELRKMNALDGNKHLVFVEKVAETQLDKEVVREAIKTIYDSRSNTCSAQWMDFANELEKELGLE